jgi:hypothetical protein
MHPILHDHLSAVTSLKWTSTGTIFVTAGRGAIINVWSQVDSQPGSRQNDEDVNVQVNRSNRSSKKRKKSETSQQLTTGTGTSTITYSHKEVHHHCHCCSFFEALQLLLTTSYSNIFYLYICRGSRTCGIPVPSVFFFRQEQEFLLNFLREKRGSGTGIPVEFLSVARTPKGQVRPLEP